MKMGKGMVQLGNGVVMPLIGFGTYQITGADPINSVVDAALKAGYRFFDTAQVYQNEAELGAALETHLPKYGLTRADIFITSKLGSHDVEKATLESLSKLRTDYLDLFLVHYPRNFFKGSDNDPENPRMRKEVWLVLEKLLASGKLRAIGVSNYEIKHLAEMNAYATVKPTVNQCEFHPHFTRAALFEYCKANGIHFQAYTSLARNNPELMNEPIVKKIADKHNASVQQVLLAWAICQNVSVLPKSVTAERIAANYRAIDVHLAADEVTAISNLNRDKPYTLTTPWLCN